jgi:hypothetical protein
MQTPSAPPLSRQLTLLPGVEQLLPAMSEQLPVARALVSAENQNVRPTIPTRAAKRNDFFMGLSSWKISQRAQIVVADFLSGKG